MRSRPKGASSIGSPATSSICLGYAEWRNFTAVISKAKTACKVSGHPSADHFVEVNKMVDLGSGSQREVDDIDAHPIRLLPDRPEWRPPKAGNRLCADLLCHPDSPGGIDRAAAPGGRARLGPQEADDHRKGAVPGHLRANGREPGLRPHPQQRGPGPVRQVDASDEGAMEGPGQPAFGRFRAHDHLEGQGLRRRNHDL